MPYVIASFKGYNVKCIMDPTFKIKGSFNTKLDKKRIAI